MLTNRDAITFYFSLISPFTYIADKAFGRLCNTYNLSVIYKPVNLRNLFDQTGGTLPKQRHISRQKYRLIDIQRCAIQQGVPIKPLPKFWPFDFSIADRMVVAAIQQEYSPKEFVSLVLEGCWVNQDDMADKETLIQYANRAKLPGEDIFASIEEQNVQDVYQNNLKEAISSSVFGLPTYVYKGEPFWGHDRLTALELMITTGRDPFLPESIDVM